MAQEALRGVTETTALFDALPSAARYELADLLGRIGRDVLAAQVALAPTDTGALRSSLAIQLLTTQLKVRVGLLTSVSRNLAKGRAKGGAFYGRFVEFGRTEHTVAVTRGRKAGGSGRTYRKNGRTLTVGAPYTMKVSKSDPRPFVNLPEGDLDAIAADRLADFWGRTLARAES